MNHAATRDGSLNGRRDGDWVFPVIRETVVVVSLMGFESRENQYQGENAVFKYLGDHLANVVAGSLVQFQCITFSAVTETDIPTPNFLA